MKITRFNLSIYIPIAFIVAILMQVLFVFTNNACAQSKSPKKDSELVNQIFKFLGRESNINSLRSKQECYAFNLRIEFKKNGNKAVVSTVKTSSAIGAQIFSNYSALEKLDYSSVIGNNSHAVVVMPILILNNPTDEKNPGDAISGMNKKSLQDLISSMLYPDVLQKNIVLFPIFTINRADVQ